MKRVAFSEAAVADLREIWCFSADTWGEKRAGGSADETEYACKDLAAGIRIGRRFAERPGTFRYGVGRHAIFYKGDDVGITVIRILHQRMDVGQRL